MLATNHVLAGAVVGTFVVNPVAAFSLGVFSHLVMDAIPHWGPHPEADNQPWWSPVYLTIARIDGITLLFIGAFFVFTSDPLVRGAVFAGAFGALLPDLDKPFDHFFGRLVNHRPLWGYRFASFNIWLQRESFCRWWVELLAFFISVSILFSF